MDKIVVNLDNEEPLETTINNEETLKATVNLGNEQALKTEIKNLNYIPQYKQFELERQTNEAERKSNEVERQNNEVKREEYINELKQEINNYVHKAVDVTYEDNYGYGGENVQDALDIAFKTLDDTPNYDDLNNYVSYSTQSKTTSQQNQARKNIGIPNACVLYNQSQSINETYKFIARSNISAKRSIRYLGEIDLSLYNDNADEFISTLTSEGEYKFTDSYDGFTWYVNVLELGDYLVGQSYCNSEEGYEYTYYRSGYYDEDNDRYRWNDWIFFMTSSQAQQLFALKNHVHYSNVITAYTIRTYLDGLTGNGDYRVTSNLDKELYIVTAYYYNVSVDGVTQYRRSQRYYSISEPWKIYSRFGLYSTSTKKITWEAWHVIEGVEE